MTRWYDDEAMAGAGIGDKHSMKVTMVRLLVDGNERQRQQRRREIKLCGVTVSGLNQNMQ